jgi:MRG-binding protein
MSKSNASPNGSSFLDTLVGESAFFRAICDARPVGVHREFHMMTVAVHVKEMTGRHVTIDELWDKFRRCYDIETLEGYVSTRWSCFINGY